MGFINIRGFRHAIDVTAGRYDDHDEPGDVTHFQALSSALSATGSGQHRRCSHRRADWRSRCDLSMVVAGFLHVLEVHRVHPRSMYRKVDAKGNISGGPMRYLQEGLQEISDEKGNTALGSFGRGLAVLFALMCIGGSFGGGNMFQVNQSGAQLSMVPFFGTDMGRLIYGVVMACAWASSSSAVSSVSVQRQSASSPSCVASTCWPARSSS